jgi:hypothetical protein
MALEQAFIDCVDQHAEPDTRDFQIEYLEEVAALGCRLDLDSPIIRVWNADGSRQIATLDTRTGEVVTVVP